MKILFILKQRIINEAYAVSYGLVNSSNQVAKYLESIGNECKIVSVVDANGIDKEVYNYKPDIVIIEALWVPAYKMKELIELQRYSDINWIIRVHSDMGFLSAETMAMKYINEYISLSKKNLFIAPNNLEFTEYLINTIHYDFLYLPNIINDAFSNKSAKISDSSIINISSFGALRILKNQCFQALCAIAVANKLNKKLRFHINNNASNGTNAVLTNLQEIFNATPEHELIVHNWLNHEDFCELVKTMDLGLQLSYTESYNIVATDFILNDTLVLGSEAITLLPKFLQCSTTDYKKVVRKMWLLYKLRNSWLLKTLQKIKFNRFNRKAKDIWSQLFIRYEGDSK